MDWHKAIEFIQHEQESSDDAFIKLIWTRLQRGDRTQDLLMTIAALDAQKNDAVSQTPEWTKAVKWLTWRRSQGSNLMVDMLWAQLESGNRTPELLHLIREAAHGAPLSLPADSELEVAPIPSADF